ncbi:16S rRNA m(7)G-527 methyltransferase [Halobacillus karajensis]|uniref:Ribosomal RNA small subunit methyltransferase G n=1 Tax=Halobacillus karajensis TaxID=195088 RepID=A0A059NZ05_9BACI|nr:16S rRNA (guanine(527)-N(7))-methyltransferase RsmG [Halobacillus karajensis]CDQ18397.1 Ribosomal RNA small subunit methyltransferase G [Halobacillus karajensis]CDQ23531.1 Ribosomal RNA small subunit methyltransferase G [Halobacillus karajensis]CDQ27013.1 Ribosomal RNA small subunit methyltransferase G [Halobacillus karajensis]SEH51963.1 16S rRNA m(7)G-527 methyltransferase [Halobacillus karajensis]
MDINTFLKALQGHGIELDDKQQKQFQRYFEILVEWNEKMNLTAITDKEGVYLKHFFDSLTAAFYYDFNQPLRICDVGAGAGFPSLPLKIAFPHLKVTIVDSLKKRITFLNHLAHELELDDVAFYHDRAESFGQNANFRENYDLVMARAVARMSVLSELCLPLVAKGGHFMAMKGPNLNDEMADANHAIQTVGGEVLDVRTFELPEEGSERNIAIIEKRRQTPKKYPRKAGTPNKYPIQ